MIISPATKEASKREGAFPPRSAKRERKPGDSSECPEDSLLWPCCRSCDRREGCPCILDQLLCHAAAQGRESAQLLREEADRLLETISCFHDVQHLLNGDRVAACALACELRRELSLLDWLLEQRARFRL